MLAIILSLPYLSPTPSTISPTCACFLMPIHSPQPPNNHDSSHLQGPAHTPGSSGALSSLTGPHQSIAFDVSKAVCQSFHFYFSNISLFYMLSGLANSPEERDWVFFCLLLFTEGSSIKVMWAWDVNPKRISSVSGMMVLQLRHLHPFTHPL